MAAHSWPFFNTPLRVFLAVVLPIAALMVPAAIVASRPWMRVSAVVVIAFSLYAFARGYLSRLIIDNEGVAFRTPARTRRIAWKDVKQVGRYTPGVGGAVYVYVTSRDEPPAGRWDTDETMIQIQDRPGLLEALTARWKGRSLAAGTASAG